MPHHRATRVISCSLPGGSVTGASQQLFDDIGLRPGQMMGGVGAIVERFIVNPSTTATIWVNLMGGAAGPGLVDSFPLAAGASWSGGVVNAITVMGVAGQTITAGER